MAMPKSTQRLDPSYTEPLEETAGKVQEQKASPLKSMQVTQVNNGFITEISSSSQPDQDAQQRASVHTDLDALVSYLQETFAE